VRAFRYEVPPNELTAGYVDNAEEGVFGYDRRLSIRPPYQREFVYREEQQRRVIDTATKGYPLNVMYWAKAPEPLAEGQAPFEVLDGQQRTLSLCEYVKGNLDFNGKFFYNLTKDEQNAFLDYSLTVYVCEGKESEKLEWFRTINIAGEKLTEQELRNAAFTGRWLADAKPRFSKTNCVAQLLADGYVTGTPIRQELLELALEWINKGDPTGYMSRHQHDATALELWNHFSSVINWAQSTFPHKRKELKRVDWGSLYEKHRSDKLDPVALELEVSRLIQDDEVDSKVGIYPYVLNRDPRHLSLRTFPDKIKREVYDAQDGVCASAACLKPGHRFKLEEMEADHMAPWHAGGRTHRENCQMLCKACNRKKGGK
jgi:hypothetical protein